MAEFKEFVIRCKSRLEKGCSDDKALALLHKLQKISVDVDLLQETGIGKVVRGLKSRQGEVGTKAQRIYDSWKQAVIDSSHQKGKEERKYKTQNDVHKVKNKNLLIEDHENISSKGKLSIDNHTKSSHQYQRTNKSDSPQKHNKHRVNNKYEEEKISLQNNYNSYYISNNSDMEEDEVDEDNEMEMPHYVTETENLYSYEKHKSSKNKYSEKSAKSEQPKYQSKSEKKSHKDSNKSEQTMQHQSSKSSTKSPSKSKDKKLFRSSSEGFNNSVASFEDILGLNDTVVTKKKKPVQVTQSNKKLPQEAIKQVSITKNVQSKTSTRKETHEKSSVKKQAVKNDGVPEALKKPKLLPLEEVDILSTLPPIQPNYKPLPHKDYDGFLKKRKNTLTNEEAIMFTSSRKDRTAVYAGRRNVYLSSVPTLYDACVRVLIENIDALAYTGGVPYIILKPVLSRCNPMQLYTLEDYNPDLLEDTDELWKIHCLREFRRCEPEDDETWRELYLRRYDEREAKLKNLTANISASMAKATQVRQTKLAYVDSVAKPPRDVARRQAKHGTGLPISILQKAGPPSKATPRPVAPMINTSSSPASSPAVGPSMPKKPRVAPLMQKTLKLMKQHFRR